MEKLEKYENADPEFGICDECGEYSRNIAYTAGDWLCEHCTRHG